MGVAETKQGHKIKFGLTKGSSDIIGWYSGVHPGPVAIFCAFEIKMPGGRATKDQKHFIEVLNRSGGFGVVVRAPCARPTQQQCDEQAGELLKQCRERFN